MKIMKKQILSKFKHYRNNIIKSLFEIVKESPNKKILLDENPCDLRIDEDGLIVQNIYKMLSIKKDTLIVHYLSGEGIEPLKYEDFDEDISMFSLDEIYNIINHIKEDLSEKTYFCESCGKKTKVYRMFDVDGTNLVESLVCLNCRDGEIPTKKC